VAGAIKEWISEEFKTLDFKSKRLEKRFMKAMSDISDHPDKSIWLASGSRSNAKAVYRMLGNEKCTKESILSSHRDAIEARNEAGVLLAIQDTMSVNYNTHTKTEGLGYNCEKKTLGVNVHSSLALIPEGIPIGVLAQSVSTRFDREDTRTKEQRRRRPIEEKESYCWLEAMKASAENVPENVKLIHIADREGDIYELYALAERTGEKFIVRATTHNRLTTDGEKTLDVLRNTSAVGVDRVVIPANHKTKRKEREAVLAVRYKTFDVRKPAILNPNKRLETSLNLTLMSLTEENPPEGVEPVEWLLMTNLPIDCTEDAIQIAKYYKQRWKIERFHFVLKSGCEIEKIQQRSIDGIELLILMYSIIAVHIMMLTYTARNFPDTPCSLLFAESEWKTLFRAVNRTTSAPDTPYSMAEALRFVAKLGGFVGAPSDGEPGLKVIWIGLNALFILNTYREFI
jgi:hypothetical protein